MASIRNMVRGDLLLYLYQVAC